MRLLPSSIFTAYLALPFATAFYPYHAQSGEVKANAGDVTARDTKISGIPANRALRVPLHRTPVKRDNEYNIISASTPTQSASVGVDQDGTDFSYFSTFKFGTSDEEYHLLLDSGAVNTWVMGSDCTTDSCAKHNSLGPSDSDTLKVTQDTFSIAYGTGSVNGTTASDKVQVSTFTVQLSFGLAEYASSEFSSYPMDGILGLGRSDETTNDVTSGTLMDALVDASLIPAKLFGVHLSRYSDGLNDGELNFGAPNPDRYDGDLAWTDTVTNDRGFWEIPIDDAAVDGVAVGLTNRTAIIDTGTSYVLMPGDDAAAVHALIPDTTRSGEIFKVPCDTTKNVQLSFSDKAYNISYKDYVGSDLGDGICQSNIIGRQTFGDYQWLVGEVFLKNVYTVFDQDSARVGFGVKDDSDELTAAETSASPVATAVATSTATLEATLTASPSAETSGTAASQVSDSSSGASSTAAAASTTHKSMASPLECSNVASLLLTLVSFTVLL